MDVQDLKNKLTETIKSYHVKGWSPATSTNYSFLDDEGKIWVSRSGVDKFLFSFGDFGYTKFLMV